MRYVKLIRERMLSLGISQVRFDDQAFLQLDFDCLLDFSYEIAQVKYRTPGGRPGTPSRNALFIETIVSDVAAIIENWPDWLVNEAHTNTDAILATETICLESVSSILTYIQNVRRGMPRSEYRDMNAELEENAPPEDRATSVDNNRIREYDVIIWNSPRSPGTTIIL